MDDNFYTTAQVAEKLQVSEKTITRWINAGTLPAIKIGRMWRVQESDLETFLTQNKTTN